MMDYSVPDYGAVENLGSYSDCYRSGSALERSQEYIHLQSVLTDAANHYGITALAFDSQEELLWIGNQGGRVSSYYSNVLQKYTAFQVQSNEIHQVEALDIGILSLTSSQMRLNTRRGLVAFTYHCQEGQDNLMCMVPLNSGQQILAGGQQTQMLRLDLNRGEVIETIELEDNCAFLCSHPRFICSADITGKVTLRDPNSLAPQCSINTHSAVLSDMDICGNMLVTCGFSNRLGSLSVDRFLILYDIRVMKAMPPMPVVFPPFQVRFVPAFSSRICVTSQGGQFQFMDTDNRSSQQATCYVQQVNTGGTPLLSFGLSTSCQALAFGDSAGYLHLLGASDQICFNTYHSETDFPDPVEPLNSIDILNEMTPLASVPMPFCEGKLLSDWPKEFCKVVYRRTPQIDAQILNSIKMVGSIGYAPNPGTRRRNQVPYVFERKGRHKNDNISSNSEVVPTRYLKIEAKYSAGRGGIEEFDFNLYNNTSFAGLEASQPNAYCNNMIQVLYFCEPLRCSLLNHLCQREFCVSCELGFLFNMLDRAQGMPCLASNFLRAFRTIPEASALGLILPDLDEARKKINFPHLAQSWVRFILQQIHMDTLDSGSSMIEEKSLEPSENQSPVSQLFGSRVRSCNVCRCSNQTEQKATSLICSLVYHDTGVLTKGVVSFCQLLESSLSVEQSITAWCDKCEKYQPMQQTKRLLTLPDVLIINCGLDNPQYVQFWKNQVDLINGGDGKKGTTIQDIATCIVRKPCRYGDNCTRLDCRFSHPRDKGKRSRVETPVPQYNPPKTNNNNNNNQTNQTGSVESWLPHLLCMQLDRETGTVSVSEAQDQEEKYELTAIICVTRDPNSLGQDNIVSLINVGPISHSNHQGATASHWYLFNDFTIVPITKEEATFFDLDWKIPCVLFYSRTDLTERHPLDVIDPLGSDVFFEDMSLASRGSRIPITFTPLAEHEMPQNTDIVAMDAEFVTLNQEEAEIRSDGTRSTIRPSQMSVARISCVRGQGPLEGVPFIDDYISTQEQVVDYLTKFSGIQPGDLDASISSKHLTTLKATYKKLLFLINTGVKFVGHGLKNDFRVVNLVVPAEQVIDTVFLFQIPNKRMVSLRFLAWHFLGLKIQAEMHDSIEDAKTALRLYRKYQTLERDGIVKEALKELYEKGRVLQWKVPSLDDD